MKKAYCLIALTLFLFNHALADDIGEIAKAKCLKCHANDPASNDSPRLGAQTPEYIFQTLKDYQAGNRRGVDALKLMTKKLKGMDEATLKGLAEYFAKTEPLPPVVGDATLMAQGKDIYENGIKGKDVRACADCHGHAGEGGGDNSALNPRVAGQWQWFLYNQLAAYKSQDIVNQKKMTEMAAKMSDIEAKAVTTYMQAL